MNHRIGRLVFAFAVGVLVAWLSFRWITNPVPRIERDVQESVVAAARQHLVDTLPIDEVELVDPLAPDRKVGKTFVFRSGDGWEVSGYYRRDESDKWHPFLMQLDASQALIHLKVQDKRLAGAKLDESVVEVVP